MTAAHGTGHAQGWPTQGDGQPSAPGKGGQESLPIYLEEIGRIALLTAEDEVRLAQAIERGQAAAERLAAEAGQLAEEELDELAAQVREGDAARRQLTEANLRLVVSMALRYMHRGVPIGDLIQEGNLGLLRAVQKFDWRHGFRFSTYAAWWIRQSIARAIADDARAIRIPVHLIRVASRVARVAAQLQQEYGRDPTAEEIGAVLGLPVEQVRELMQLTPQMISLDGTVGEDEDLPLAELVPDETTAGPEEVIEHHLLRDCIRQALLTLTPRERYVIQRRFGFEAEEESTFSEISKEVGVSKERIRQIGVIALSKLRHPSRAKQLHAHFGRDPLPGRPRRKY
ncbi:MAG TPA: sigma-70 family RNA polymerase sigma factor [Chloroflexota bacterium]|nr:sigma-70 family RNA polymerase sigma factor [Chloroflexota bacterium]